MFTDTNARPVSGRYYPLTFAQLVHRTAQFPRSAENGGNAPRIRAHRRNSLVETVYGNQLCTLAPSRYLAILSLPDSVPAAHGLRAIDSAFEHMRLFGDAQSPVLRARCAHTFYRAFLAPLGQLTITRDVRRWRGYGWSPYSWGQVIALSPRYRECPHQEVILRTTIASRRLWR